MSAPVSYALNDGVAKIGLDDGKANVLSLPMQAAINSAIDSAEKDNAIILLHGRPGKFSAGFDLATLTGGGEDAVAMLMGGFGIAKRLLGHPRPVVVACSGHALAMGLFLVLCADYSVGTAGDFKLCANEVAIGLTLPRTAIEICRNRLAPAHFARATLTSESYSPAQAIPAGMLDAVVGESQLLDTAMARAESFKALDAAAYKGSKAIIRKALLEKMDETMAQDRKSFKKMFNLD